MSNTPASPTAICFDLDDTLIDDTGASSAGLHALMERLGHPDFGAARSLWDVQTEISFSAYLRGRLSLEQQRRERVRALAVQTGQREMMSKLRDIVSTIRANSEDVGERFRCRRVRIDVGVRIDQDDLLQLVKQALA